jgi:predicted MFS family arabinose efflux permease
MNARLVAQRYLLVLGTFWLAVLLYVDRVCISTAESAIMNDLQLSSQQFGWVLSAFALGYALLAFCIDIGRRNSGAVSGTMKMAGNLGSFVTSLAFPYLLSWTATPNTFFYVGATLNVLAVSLWLLVRPDRPIEEY